MHKYRLYVLFELRDAAGTITHHEFDETCELKNLKAAEKILSEKISELVSGFSDQSLLWTIVEKHITLQESIQSFDIMLI